MIGFWLVILDGYSTTKQNDLDLVQMGIIRKLKFMRKLNKRSIGEFIGIILFGTLLSLLRSGVVETGHRKKPVICILESEQ
jgi:hypothetical protein